MTRDEGIHLPVGKRLPSQESLLKYDADAVAMGPRANCWRRYGRERIASFVKGPATGHSSESTGPHPGMLRLFDPVDAAVV
jgi:hypothetical protein